MPDHHKTVKIGTSCLWFRLLRNVVNTCIVMDIQCNLSVLPVAMNINALGCKQRGYRLQSSTDVLQMCDLPQMTSPKPQPLQLRVPKGGKAQPWQQ